jgi:chromosome segregation ATPase
MEQSTETDLSALLIEENRRELILIFTPLIQQAVHAAIPQELTEAAVALKQTREDLRAARQEIQDIRAAYITAEQAEQNWQNYADKISEPLKKRLDQHLSDWNREDERRHSQYLQQIAGIEQKVQQNDTRVAENEKKIATLQATAQQQFDQIDRRLTRTETDIDKNIKKMADSANTMNLTFAKFLQEYETQAKANARNIEDLETAQGRTDKRLVDLQDDTGNLRQDVDGLRADIATKVKTTELTVKHIESETSEIKQRQSNQSAETELVKRRVMDIEVQLKSALWLLNTWAGRAVLLTILTLLGLSNLVS